MTQTPGPTPHAIGPDPEMMLLTQCDSEVRETLAGELAGVEQRFADELLSDLDCVNELTHHIERYRGKMLRPTLVLLSAMALDPIRPGPTHAHRVVATVAEMIHMATLVHDDILDDAEIRRRGKTVNQLEGNETAVMLGDFLISHAYHLCSSIGRSDVSRRIAAATNTVCEGELLQLANRNNWQLDERTYFEIIRRKTASLCGVCCESAATLGEASREMAEALYAYGEHLGIAFQIVDDVLDLTGDEETVGKTLGRDLDKAKLTLPLIRFLADADADERAAVIARLDALGSPDVTDAERRETLAETRDKVARSDGLDYAKRHAAGLIETAKSGIATRLPESPVLTLMLDMADAVLSREY